MHGVGSGETGTWLESTLPPAKGAAERVYGSAKMENELEVRVLNESKEEAALLESALSVGDQALQRGRTQESAVVWYSRRASVDTAEL